MEAGRVSDGSLHRLKVVAREAGELIWSAEACAVGESFHLRFSVCSLTQRVVDTSVPPFVEFDHIRRIDKR